MAEPTVWKWGLDFVATRQDLSVLKQNLTHAYGDCLFDTVAVREGAWFVPTPTFQATLPRIQGLLSGLGSVEFSVASTLRYHPATEMIFGPSVVELRYIVEIFSDSVSARHRAVVEGFQSQHQESLDLAKDALRNDLFSPFDPAHDTFRERAEAEIYDTFRCV